MIQSRVLVFLTICFATPSLSNFVKKSSLFNFLTCGGPPSLQFRQCLSINCLFFERESTPNLLLKLGQNWASNRRDIANNEFVLVGGGVQTNFLIADTRAYIWPNFLIQKYLGHLWAVIRECYTKLFYLVNSNRNSIYNINKTIKFSYMNFSIFCLHLRTWWRKFLFMLKILSQNLQGRVNPFIWPSTCSDTWDFCLAL